jgi:acyl dehydratase
LAVNPELVGRAYRLDPPYQVDAAALRAFARAVGATHPACFDAAAARALGYRDVVAAPTFAAVIAQAAEALYIADPAAGIDFSRVVHAAQSFRHTRPIVAGELIAATTRVVGVTERSGIVQVTTETELTCVNTVDDDGPRALAQSTLAVRLGAA